MSDRYEIARYCESSSGTSDIKYGIYDKLEDRFINLSKTGNKKREEVAEMVKQLNKEKKP